MARYVLRTLDSEVHPSCIHGLKHFFGRSVVALRDAELLDVGTLSNPASALRGRLRGTSRTPRREVVLQGQSWHAILTNARSSAPRSS